VRFLLWDQQQNSLKRLQHAAELNRIKMSSKSVHAEQTVSLHKSTGLLLNTCRDNWGGTGRGSILDFGLTSIVFLEEKKTSFLLN